MHKLKIFLGKTRNIMFSLVLSHFFLGVFRDFLFVISFSAVMGLYIGYSMHSSFLQDI